MVVFYPYCYHLDSENINQGMKKGNLFLSSLLTYDKEYKDLKVPDEAHPAVSVLVAVVDVTIVEGHVPTGVSTVL